MSDRIEFLELLKKAIGEKSLWFNTTELPQLLDNYRLLHTCIKNLYEVLVKRSLITPDPYKLEKKISTIKAPEDSPYAESERAVVIGARFSDYESMLDFICTYFKLSVENLDLQKIKKLTELNNSFQWTNMSLNNSKINTRGLAKLLNDVRHNLTAITLSMVNDSVSKSSQALTEITKILKEVSEYKREEYKFKIRMDIFRHPNFSESNIHTQEDEILEIKKLFSEVMGKQPFYSELINEIVAEDLAENKESLQNQTLNKLRVKIKEVKKEKETLNTKNILLDTIHILSTLSPVYSVINEKLSFNCKILSDEKNTLFQRIKNKIRKIFNIKEPPIIYRVIIEDRKKQTKTSRDIDIGTFISNIERKTQFLRILNNKSSPEFLKIESSTEDSVLQFINKQISDNKETLSILSAIDDYIKANTNTLERSKIKGLKIDLITVNNVIVKANKKRAEYVSDLEEIKQMEKLGIKNE